MMNQRILQNSLNHILSSQTELVEVQDFKNL